MAQQHRVAIDIGIFHNQIIARLQHITQGKHFIQHVSFGVVAIQDGKYGAGKLLAQVFDSGCDGNIR